MPVPSSSETKSARTIRGDDAVRALDVRVQRLVPETIERTTGKRSGDDWVVRQHRVLQCLGKNESLAVVVDDDVRRVRGDGQSLVRHECPRRRRPSDRGRPGERRVRGVDSEQDVHARILDELVALGRLVVGEGRAAARAIPRDAVILIQQPALVELLQRPPDALDVLGVHRPVRVGQVDPEAEPFGEPFEVIDVAED